MLTRMGLRWKVLTAVTRSTLLTCLLGMFPGAMFGQAVLRVVGEELPDAPSAALTGMAQAQQRASQRKGTASISGVVLDVHEGIVPEATVTLTEEGAAERKVTSDDAGRFVLPELPPGKYRLIIKAADLETFASSEINLKEGEHYELPRIALPLAIANVSVNVTVTQEEIAQEQVSLQEKQRFLGVFPTFYTSYFWDAAPMNKRQKFDLATKSITDPVIFVVTAAAAGYELHRNTFPEYGSGFSGYAKRYLADYGDELSNRMFSSAILPSLFHQDPRYFYKGTGSRSSRAWYAITRAVVTRGDNGRSQPNYSRVLGGFAAGLLSNAYHLGGDRGVFLTTRNSSIAIGGHALDNLLKEFLFKRFTPNLPDDTTGQPTEVTAKP